MILWAKSDCSPDWTELLSILADLAKLTEKCSKNCGLLPWPIKAKLHVEHPWEEDINGPGHLTKMAAMPIYGKNHKKICFSVTGGPISTKLGV